MSKTQLEETHCILVSSVTSHPTYKMTLYLFTWCMYSNTSHSLPFMQQLHPTHPPIPHTLPANGSQSKGERGQQGGRKYQPLTSRDKSPRLPVLDPMQSWKTKRERYCCTRHICFTKIEMFPMGISSYPGQRWMSARFISCIMGWRTKILSPTVYAYIFVVTIFSPQMCIYIYIYTVVTTLFPKHLIYRERERKQNMQFNN